MVLYTNQPYELIFPEKRAEIRDISVPGGVLETLRCSNGSMRIRRLISTDPRAYLNPAYSPGAEAGHANGTQSEAYSSQFIG